MTCTRTLPRPNENVARRTWASGLEKARSIRRASAERRDRRWSAFAQASSTAIPADLRGAAWTRSAGTPLRGDVTRAWAGRTDPDAAAGRPLADATVARCRLEANPSAVYHACESARRSIAPSGAARMLTSSCCVIMAPSSQERVIPRSSHPFQFATFGMSSRAAAGSAPRRCGRTLRSPGKGECRDIVRLRPARRYMLLGRVLHRQSDRAMREDSASRR
jgi:hypothetical protein